MLTPIVRFFFAANVILLSGCQIAQDTNDSLFGPGVTEATLTPRASTYQDLKSLPSPRGKIVATVYNFRDQTGQYKPIPASSFSTAVTQGATAMLINAMNESGWFIPLEREGLQNLLTERKIIRAALKKPGTPTNNDDELPSLLAANVLIEGGIVAYESNIKTGGAGARYFGIGASEQYRADQVTVNIRAIDIRSGRILHSVLTTKSILSQEITTGVFRFVEYKRLLEIEAGTTTNEPAQLCVLSAIESALIHLIAQGIESSSWSLANIDDVNNPTLQQYMTQEPMIN
ncbi:CsgG/HfaB family protein [Simiduia litorea]|uniref:CsgG/HfaB family protein n=1 Tax=Simiduia litorea TaxID=1435348 RepID=UPI0036F36B6E